MKWPPTSPKNSLIYCAPKGGLVEHSDNGCYQNTQTAKLHLLEKICTSEKDELEKWHFLQVCKLGKRAMFCKMKTLEMA